MLQIQINRRFLKLFEKTSVRFSVYSPVVGINEQPGSFSYGFDIPVRGNEVALNHIHLIEKTGYANNSFACQVFYYSAKLFPARLIILEISTDKIRCSLSLFSGMFATSFGEENWSEMNLGTFSRGNTSFTYPMHLNDLFYGKDYGMAEINYTIARPRVAFPKLKFVLTETFKRLGYTNVYGAFMNHLSTNELILYANYDQANQDGSLDNNVVLSNLVPEVNFKNYLVNLGKLFNLYFYFRSEKEVEIGFKQDLLNITPVDFSKRTSREYSYQTSEAPTSFIWQYKEKQMLKSEYPGTPTKYFSYASPGYYNQDQKITIIESEILTIGERFDNERYLRFSFLGNSKVLRTTAPVIDITTRNPRENRLLFYRGRSSEDSYGGIDRYWASYKGTNYNLDWQSDGGPGLYEMFWMGWERIMRENKTIKTKLYYSANDLVSNFDLIKPILIEGNRFFIKKLEFELDTEGQSKLIIASAELLKYTLTDSYFKL